MTDAPRCDKPGCGLVMTIKPMRYHDDLRASFESYKGQYECPRNADAHALCARVAELEGRLIVARHGGGQRALMDQRDTLKSDNAALRAQLETIRGAVNAPAVSMPKRKGSTIEDISSWMAQVQAWGEEGWMQRNLLQSDNAALRDLPDTCDFCGATVPANKIEPQSGDQWACHACLDRWEQEDRDAEVARIMAMTDEEIRQDCIAQGTTVEAKAAEVQAIFQKALDKFKEESHGE